MIASSDSFGRVLARDYRTAEVKAELRFPKAPVVAVLSPSGDFLATTAEHVTSVWQLPDPGPEPLWSSRPGLVVESFAGSDRLVAIGENFQRVLVSWRAPDGKEQEVPWPRTIRGYDVAETAPLMALGGAGSVEVWDLDRFEKIRSLQTDLVGRIRLAPDGSFAAWISAPEFGARLFDPGSLWIWRALFDGPAIKLFDIPDGEAPDLGFDGMTISRRGDRIAFASDVRIFVIERDTGRVLVSEPWPEHAGPSGSLAWTGDGEALITKTARAIQMWTLELPDLPSY